MKPKQKKKIEEYPENVLNNGAENAVTGGHPEEMNEMPPDLDPSHESPVIDGSDLPAPKQEKHFTRSAA